MKLKWLVVYVPMLCICSANNTNYTRRIRKRDIQSNPFLQGVTKKFYPDNPFLSSAEKISTHPTDGTRTREEIIANNPFFQNGGNSHPADAACGLSVVVRHLIVKGNDYEEGAYPWLVALLLVKEHGTEFSCGGTLISEKHILTSAHCVVEGEATIDPQHMVASLGKFNIEDLSMSDPSIYKIQNVHRHSDYVPKSTTADADIGVLELQRKVIFNKFIIPACLWAGDDNLNSIVGHIGRMAGWGTTEDGLASQRRPKEARLPIVSQEACLESNSQFKSVTSDRTFCAGFANSAAPCSGDSGGGLVVEVNGQYAVRGVVSLSVISDAVLSGCDLRYYVVFTDVSKFVSWISQILTN